MELSNKEFIILFLLSLGAGAFGVCIAMAVGYLSITKGAPRKIVIIAIIVQMGLSIGLFIGLTLWFYSQLTPESLSKDFITGCCIAYFGSAVPEITFGVFVLLTKIIKHNIRKTMNYEGEDITPDLKLRSIVDDYVSTQKDKK
ncbi:hypothetical protein CQA37_09810 [Helicobacter sp. MIT 99-10781]|uniref:hypothetical protein n=1 Tax=Helicobacter sp. MIT 99-10781 TaxID=1332285 RepID=UPI000E204D60|nr:hypothetical protein [Helicobacter sp. MIT 99-10781]RDU51315.1 hypothetical protein CQA37_09810 [Helicobacter sp. MIT 99-10781]